MLTMFQSKLHFHAVNLYEVPANTFISPNTCNLGYIYSQYTRLCTVSEVGYCINPPYFVLEYGDTLA